MLDALAWLPSTATVADLVTTLAPVVVGGILVWFGSFLQHRWTTRREDRRREAEERADRIQHEREIIADLITALLPWASAVANLGLAYSQARNGAILDRDRIRDYLEEAKKFGAALVRARVSVRNPAARPSLDELHRQHIRMTNHLNLQVLGQPSSEFTAHFEEFQSAVGHARLALESAALGWDGSMDQEGMIDSPRQREPTSPLGVADNT